MKSVIGLILLLCFTIPVHATYYEITSGYDPGLTLNNSDSLLMTGGGLGELSLYSNSTATIQGTSHLEQGFGGIWTLNLTGNGCLNFSGGEVDSLVLGNYATAALSGGKIVQIWSGQYAWKYYHPDGGYPPIPIHDPHIEIICREYSYNTETKKLTGLWNVDANNNGLFDPFNIQLIDVQGYSPAIENIKFTIIPEPATIALLALGGLLLRRR